MTDLRPDAERLMGGLEGFLVAVHKRSCHLTDVEWIDTVAAFMVEIVQREQRAMAERIAARVMNLNRSPTLVRTLEVLAAIRAESYPDSRLADPPPTTKEG